MWSGDKLEEEEGNEFNEGLVGLARRGAESEDGARLLDPSAADVHSLHFLLLFDLGQKAPTLKQCALYDDDDDGFHSNTKRGTVTRRLQTPEP